MGKGVRQSKSVTRGNSHLHCSWELRLRDACNADAKAGTVRLSRAHRIGSIAEWHLQLLDQQREVNTAGCLRWRRGRYPNQIEKT